jgi:hypothetical protein
LVWFVGAFAAHFSADTKGHWRVQLHRLARMVESLLVVQAAALVQPPPRRNHRHGRLQRVNVRNIVGARLRRAMRGKDLPARLAAIVSVMRDHAHHIAKLARRLARGLTRLRVILPVPECASLVPVPPFTQAACADTS